MSLGRDISHLDFLSHDPLFSKSVARLLKSSTSAFVASCRARTYASDPVALASEAATSAEMAADHGAAFSDIKL